MSEFTHGYAAVCRMCGGWVLLTADIPQRRKQTAKEIAACIREGYEVRRITKAEGQAMPMCPDDCEGRNA